MIVHMLRELMGIMLSYILLHISLGFCSPISYVHAYVPVQRHITGVLENTRVFDEKYPGIFQYPGFIDKYPGIFHQIPGYLTACQIPG